ncbi:MAG: hypothetical protein RLZZ324_1223, partial [Candidatus Parcubacteria bacterium]
WFLGINATDDTLHFWRNGASDTLTVNNATGDVTVANNLTVAPAGKLVATSLQLLGGTPGAGKVLQSDASGNMSWSAGAVNVDAAGKLTVAGLQVTGGTPGAGKVLTSDASGNATWAAPGAGGGSCSNRQYVGMTAATYDGSRGGYVNVDALCNTFSAGSKACSAEEVMNSYKCGGAAIGAASGSAWVNAGPPGFTALGNDCDGWTTNAASGAYGRYWTFVAATGGKGALINCNNALKYACCK